jgi:hypothetical protein
MVYTGRSLPTIHVFNIHFSLFVSLSDIHLLASNSKCVGSDWLLLLPLQLNLAESCQQSAFVRAINTLYPNSLEIVYIVTSYYLGQDL